MFRTRFEENVSVPAKEPTAKNPIAVAFGERVDLLRKRRGMTQKELGRLSQYDPISMSRLINGEIMPKIDTAIRIARALSVPEGDLFSLAISEGSSAIPQIGASLGTDDSRHSTQQAGAVASRSRSTEEILADDILHPIVDQVEAVVDVLRDLLSYLELPSDVRSKFEASLASRRAS